MSWRRLYFSVDPRTLGLMRIALGVLLLVDLAKRSTILSVFYTNSGLIPNHRVLWRPWREAMFSFLLSLSAQHEVVLAFGLIAAVYLCFLVGYRTRLMHLLSWLCLVSLQVRVDLLSNGGDFVFSDVMLWTLFLPLGRRFSLDALTASFRSAGDHTLDQLRALAQTPRDTQPAVSLAVLAGILQLSVIYVFNAIHKTGATWRDGSAVYWLLHQERVVTTLGLALRHTLPLPMFQALSYSTLLMELAIPVLMLTPWGQPWARRAAIFLVFALHTGIALLANLGMFSPVMMVFSLLLLDADAWNALQARAARKPQLQLYVEASSGLCWQLARLWVRCDVHQRSELLPMAALPPTARAQLAGEPGFVVENATGSVLRLQPALRLSNYLGWTGATSVASEAAPLAMHANAPFAERVRLVRSALRESAVIALMIVAISQVLVENPAIPRRWRLEQPPAIRAAVGYFRLNQGWSMFAPDAPTQDQWIVVDARTSDGRHVDPFNALASRVADPSLRSIPERLGQSAAYCDYTARIPDEELFHGPLRDWILDYHRRTGRPDDRIVHFKAYVVEQDSPRPDERQPNNVHARVFLTDGALDGG